MTLLLWGRGVYCGWLCPFGALQELVNQVGAAHEDQATGNSRRSCMSVSGH